MLFKDAEECTCVECEGKQEGQVQVEIEMGSSSVQREEDVNREAMTTIQLVDHRQIAEEVQKQLQVQHAELQRELVERNRQLLKSIDVLIERRMRWCGVCSVFDCLLTWLRKVPKGEPDVSEKRRENLSCAPIDDLP